MNAVNAIEQNILKWLKWSIFVMCLLHAPPPPPHPTNTEISLFSGADIEQYLCPNFALLVSDLPDSAIPEIAAFLVLQS